MTYLESQHFLQRWLPFLLWLLFRLCLLDSFTQLGNLGSDFFNISVGHDCKARDREEDKYGLLFRRLVRLSRPYCSMFWNVICIVCQV